MELAVNEPQMTVPKKKTPFEAPLVPVKLSIQFDAADYAWAKRRSEEFFGRRGIGLYVRRLVREDRKACGDVAGEGRPLGSFLQT